MRLDKHNRDRLYTGRKPIVPVPGFVFSSPQAHNEAKVLRDRRDVSSQTALEPPPAAVHIVLFHSRG